MFQGIKENTRASLKRMYLVDVQRVRFVLYIIFIPSMNIDFVAHSRERERERERKKNIVGIIFITLT